MRELLRFRLPAGATLCAVGGITGSPVDVEFFGPHIAGDIGLVAVLVALVALVAGAVVWMFNRWGAPADGPAVAVASDSDALWRQLEELEELGEPVRT